MERHTQLKRIARLLYGVPGVSPAVRVLVRQLIQCSLLPLKTKQQLFNFFAKDTAPAQTIECRVHVPGNGSIRLQLDLRDDLSRTWYYWGYGDYEVGVTGLLRRLLAFKSCVFDVGANIGYYTLLMGALLKGRGEVHAFEPLPTAFRFLSSNVQMNRFQHVHVNQLALSNHDGQALLYLPADQAWSNASLIEGFTYQNEQMFVETMRFDTYCAAYNIGRVDLVKIDVEGAETRVLEGMGALLDMWQPDIICEVLQPYETALNVFFRGKSYRKFLITDTGLEETDWLKAHPRFRDYYLSCKPISFGSG